MSIQAISLLADDFEDLELWYPRYRLAEEGIEVIFAAAQKNKMYYGKHGVTAISEMQFSEMNAERFELLLIPGGWAPDKLRRYPEVIQFVREMDSKKRLIGQICHAGWVLISAGILSGRTITSTPGIKDDLLNAGAKWLDEAVVIDQNLISGRGRADLPQYSKALIAAVNQRG